MALSIKDDQTDRLVRDLAGVTGESMTEAVKRSVAERLVRERRKRGLKRSLVEEVDEIVKRLKAAPDYDTRSPDEIVGYDENGMW